MWEYNHTDDMYTGRFDRSEKLFHSDVYLGQDFSDGIRHWKYTHKKKGPNGKWIYYYANKIGKNEYGIYKKTDGDKNSKYGTYERNGEKHTVKKTNEFLSKTYIDGASFKDGKTTVHKVTKVGALERNADYTKNKVKKFGKSLSKKIKRGKKALAKLFKSKKGKSSTTIKSIRQ